MIGLCLNNATVTVRCPHYLISLYLDPWYLCVVGVTIKHGAVDVIEVGVDFCQSCGQISLKLRWNMVGVLVKSS